MEKDQTIIHIIRELKLIFDFSSIAIVDYWDADLCAIGLKKGNKLVYISTYNYYKNKNISYDVDFEIVKNKQDNLNVVKIMRNISQEELLKEVNDFFNLHYNVNN